MERLLNSTYKEPDRPHSQDELRDTRTRNLGRLRVGSTMASHQRCLHFYFAKDGGKKEAQLIESGGDQPGYCSVCWKLKKTTPELREKAADLIDEYQHRFGEKPEKWTHYMVELEKTFYRWLYFEPDRKRKKARSATTHSTEAEKDHNGETSAVEEFPVIPGMQRDPQDQTVSVSQEDDASCSRRWEQVSGKSQETESPDDVSPKKQSSDE